MVSVHSLAALTEQMNGNNTRVLTNIAEEQAQDPGPRGQDGQPGQPSESSPPRTTAGGSASSSVEHGVQGSDLPTESSAGCSGDSRASEGVRGALHSSAGVGPAADGTLPSSASSADDPVAQGSSGSAEAHAEGSGQVKERPLVEKSAGARKPSRLSSLVSRFRRRTAAQAPIVSSSSAGGTAERADADGHTAQQSSSAASQLDSPSGAPRSLDPAAPEQTPVTPIDGRPAAVAGASGHSSGAAAASSSDLPHRAGAAQASAQAAVRLDWDKMNESMMHSLHSVISNLTTVLIAQVSTQPCRVPSHDVPSSSVGLAPEDLSQTLSYPSEWSIFSMRFQSGSQSWGSGKSRHSACSEEGHVSHQGEDSATALCC